MANAIQYKWTTLPMKMVGFTQILARNIGYGEEKICSLRMALSVQIMMKAEWVANTTMWD